MDDYQMKQNKINEDRYKAELNKDIRSLESAMKSFNDSVADLKSSQDSLRVSLHEDFDNFEMRIMDKVKSYRDMIDQSKKASDSLVKSYSKDMENLKSMFVLEDEFSKKINDVNQSSLDSLKEMKQMQSSITDYMKRLKDEVFSKMDQVVKSIPVVESPKEVEERNNKIELLTLDVSNANVRSVNCEKKLGMIEKRLEQINLIIKQLTMVQE